MSEDAKVTATHHRNNQKPETIAKPRYFRDDGSIIVEEELVRIGDGFRKTWNESFKDKKIESNTNRQR